MKNRLSNGPLRAQSKAKAEYSATFGTRKLSGICLYPVKCMASAMNQGGTTDKSIIRPWQRFSSFCQGLFLLYGRYARRYYHGTAYKTMAPLIPVIINIKNIIFA